MISHQQASILYNNSPQSINSAANKRNIQVPSRYPQEMNNVNNPYSSVDYNESQDLSYDPNNFGNEKKIYLNHVTNHESKQPKSNKPSDNKLVIPLNNAMIDSANSRLSPSNFGQNTNLKVPNIQSKANYGEIAYYNNENYPQEEFKNGYKPHSKSPVASIYNISLILLILILLDEK